MQGGIEWTCLSIIRLPVQWKYVYIQQYNADITIHDMTSKFVGGVIASI